MRIVYRLDEDAVLILHVFSKKTQHTPKSVIEACKAILARYDAL
jgi:phage-related protein